MTDYYGILSPGRPSKLWIYHIFQGMWWQIQQSKLLNLSPKLKYFVIILESFPPSLFFFTVFLFFKQLIVFHVGCIYILLQEEGIPWNGRVQISCIINSLSQLSTLEAAFYQIRHLVHLNQYCVCLAAALQGLIRLQSFTQEPLIGHAGDCTGGLVLYMPSMCSTHWAMVFLLLKVMLSTLNMSDVSELLLDR